jgi:hypothetical protein
MTVAGAHNGGRSQVNFNFLQTGGDYAFLNLMKASQGWTLVDNSGFPAPDTLDSNGYPTTITNGGVFTVFYVPTQAARAGNYVITWDGNGTIRCNMSNTLVSGSKTSSTGSGRYVFSTTDTRFDVGISAIGSPAVSNIKVYHIDDETAILDGDVFGAKFKERLTEAKFGVYRFLDWQGANGTNITTWATRKPVSFVFYSGGDFRSALYTGVASVDGTNRQYSVSAPSSWSGLVDKATVHVKFSATADLSISGSFTNGQANITLTAHSRSVNDRVIVGQPGGSVPGGYTFNQVCYVVSVPDADTVQLSATQGGSAIVASSTTNTRVSPIITLNVGSTGDIDVLTASSFYVTGSSNPDSSYYPTAGRTATLIYDALLNKWIKHGGDGVDGNIGVRSGVPPEIMVQLCAEMGAHPWFCAPYLACSPMTDWFTQLATYCRDNGPSWMVPRFEGVNELWNSALGFYGTPYANAVGVAYGWGAGDYHNWYGRVISTIGQDISAVYSDDRTRYRMICGVQTTTTPSSSNARLASTKYLLQTPQSGYLADAASNWVTDLCVANYITPSAYGTGTETTLATAYAGGDATAPITYAATVVSGGTFTLDAVNTRYGDWKTWAQGFSITRMCGYEGGYSPDYTGSSASQVNLLRAASKLAPELLYYTMLNYNNFIGKSDGSFTADFPSCYLFAGNPNVNVSGLASAWSVLEDVYVSSDPPQWDAIVLFNDRKRRLKIKT